MSNETQDGLIADLGKVKVKQIKRMLELYNDETELDFVFIIGSFFPKALEQMKLLIQYEHTHGYTEGYADGLKEGKNAHES